MLLTIGPGFSAFFAYRILIGYSIDSLAGAYDSANWETLCALHFFCIVLYCIDIHRQEMIVMTDRDNNATGMQSTACH